MYKKDKSLKTQITYMSQPGDFVLSVKEEPISIRVDTIHTVDVAIMMDLTGSMGNEIKAAEHKVMDVFRLLQEKHPEKTFRLGFVGYRDYTDKVPFVICPLTTDILSVQQTIASLKAEGGDDAAEDFSGGLENIVELSWNADVRQVLCVTDAPGHGLAYHETNVSDYYPDGDINGHRLEDQMGRIAAHNIGFTFFRMNAHTDKMTHQLVTAYQAHRVPGTKANFILADVADQLMAAAHVDREYHSLVYDRDRLYSDEDDVDRGCDDDVYRGLDMDRGSGVDRGLHSYVVPGPSDASFANELFEAISSQL